MIQTFLRSPFFHRYPALITLSSAELWRWPSPACAVFQPPSPSSSSSSESSPLPDLRSAIDDRGCCWIELPGIIVPATGPIPEGERFQSGVKIESESDSVPETGGTDTDGGGYKLLVTMTINSGKWKLLLTLVVLFATDEMESFRWISWGEGGAAEGGIAARQRATKVNSGNVRWALALSLFTCYIDHRSSFRFASFYASMHQKSKNIQSPKSVL